MSETDFTNLNAMHPDIELDVDALPMAIPDMEEHDRLLGYLNARLMSGTSKRQTRATRYAKIDKSISTWQRLSAADSVRSARQEADGKAQAIAMNLPLVHTHVDDMVSFFAGIYAPAAGDFFQVPDAKLKDEGAGLIDKLNSDAKREKHYKHLCAFLRSSLKYNIGGFHLRWVSTDDMSLDEPSKGVNQATSVDMYNVMWDTTITDPSKVSKEAEWASITEVKNHRWLVQREVDGMFHGVESLFEGRNYSNGGVQAKYYKNPPSDVNLEESGGDSVSTRGQAGMDWKVYGASLGSSTTVEIDAFEVTTMYCWLDPAMFKMRAIQGDVEAPLPGGNYMLWQFTIANAERIISADPVVNQKPNEDGTPVDIGMIPIYLGLMNQDDMREFQRSIAEFLAPFQSYGSFLMNAHVANTRADIYGTKVYDPQMIDPNQLETGETALVLKSKVPGRDVRSAIMKVGGDGDTSKTMESMNNLSNMIQQYFPSQALPNQVAGIDRAVQSQVAAVMQGVNRRLHMLVRLLDDDVMSPTRMGMYKNIVTNGAVPEIIGMTDDVAYRILGSGLAQLNREAGEQAMRQLIFAIIQNQAATQSFNIPMLMDFWGSLMNLNTKLSDFAAAPPVAATAEGTPASAPPAA